MMGATSMSGVDVEPRYYDRERDRVVRGQPWCPCGENVIGDAAGWPLDIDDPSQHRCPLCPAGDDQVACGPVRCPRGHFASSARRFTSQRVPPLHDDPPMAVFEHAVASAMPLRTYVEVEVWSGCDEDWPYPVYVSAWPTPPAADGSSPYHDAVCDLLAAPLEDQVRYVVEQLLDG